MIATVENVKSTTYQLSNGQAIPKLGLGVLKAQEGQEVIRAVKYALEEGYRSIDTAAAYRNEQGVGAGIKQSGIPRKDIFLTTKVWNSDQGYDATLRAFDQSLNALDTDYVDLYLVHWPVKGKYKQTWKALEHIYRNGQAKAIGVSNFQVHHLEDLFQSAEIMPMVNQVEMHPWLQQNELLQFSQENNIVVEAWRPIMQGQVSYLPLLQELSMKYGKTPVQITLRWLIQKGVVAIPK
ncbi:MAG: aldo/keto reductase, partial [Bacteroidota bacterium]